MAQELLYVHRAAEFVAFCMDNDLQILINRRQARVKLLDSLARRTDPPEHCLRWGAENFEKMETFLSQNDAQVHYHSDNSVAVYAMVRLLGSLRRALRDMPAAVADADTATSMLLSPSAPGVRRIAPAPLARTLFPASETGAGAYDTGSHGTSGEDPPQGGPQGQSGGRRSAAIERLEAERT